MRAFLPLLVCGTAALAFAAPASAATAEVVANADLDGDGQRDEVVAEPVADNPNEQLLVATVRGIPLTARAPLDSHIGVQPLRVVDVNADGREEVVVTESVGANTVGFGVWGLSGGLRPVLVADQTPMRLWEGGGISAISRYGCEPTGSGRQLVTVSAELIDWENLVYQGERVTHSVHNGVATETSRTPVAGGSDDPALRADPQTCA